MIKVKKNIILHSINAGKYLSLFFILIFLISSCQNKKPDQKLIGTVTREFTDSTRSNWLDTGPRPLRVIIWYPSEGGGTKEISKDNGSFILLRNGKLSSQSSKYPLILLSHGSGQKASQMFWLGSYLSMHGYITISINHNGTAEEEMRKGSQTLSDFCFWERPKDLSSVLNFILKDSFFIGKIDTQKIGAAGFSLGGATVIMSAGARLNLDTLKKNSPPPPQKIANEIERFIKLSKTNRIIKISVENSGNSFKDKRIKAVFALAPAVGGGFSKEGLAGINIPVMIAAGDKDLVAPAETNAERYNRYISNSKLILLPGEAGHFILEKSESKRKKIIDHVSKLALDFFNEKLKIEDKNKF